jgi:hypothetical protein
MGKYATIKTETNFQGIGKVYNNPLLDKLAYFST